MRPMNEKHQNGFTIYELMIVLTIIGIILAMGVPSFTEFTQNSRLTSTANDLLASFQVARSEAARAKSNITICASADGATCGGTLNDGWIVFVDLNGDIVRAGPGENLLRVQEAAPPNVTITPNAGATYFSFAATGLGRGNVVGPALQTAMICDQRGLTLAAGGRATARRLVATPIGRATIINDLTTIVNSGDVCP